MKAASKLMLGLALVFVATVVARAEDKAEGTKKTLTGNIVCGKCTLGETDECSNVLQVTTDDGKVVNYYIKDKGKAEKKYHACAPNSKKKAKVTGVVAKKDGKMWISNATVELIK